MLINISFFLRGFYSQSNDTNNTSTTFAKVVGRLNPRKEDGMYLCYTKHYINDYIENIFIKYLLV